MMPIMRIIFPSSLCAMSDQRIPELYTSPHTPTAPREKLNPKEHNPKEETPKGENPKELWKEPQIYYSLLAGSWRAPCPTLSRRKPCCTPGGASANLGAGKTSSNTLPPCTLSTGGFSFPPGQGDHCSCNTQEEPQHAGEHAGDEFRMPQSEGPGCSHMPTRVPV